jgi:hypothetical protein
MVYSTTNHWREMLRDICDLKTNSLLTNLCFGAPSLFDGYVPKTIAYLAGPPGLFFVMANWLLGLKMMHHNFHCHLGRKAHPLAIVCKGGQFANGG